MWLTTEAQAQDTSGEANTVSLQKNCPALSRIMSQSHSSLSEHDLPHYVAPFTVHPRIPSRGDNPIPPNRGYSYSPCIKEDQFFAQHTIPVRTPRQQPCLRKWKRDEASEGWLHRCSCREKQVQSLREFIALQKIVPCHAHHTVQARENLLRYTLTQTEVEQGRKRRTGETPHK